ncbi:hypothetical protein FKM82_002212 [Ascaphus truei]
MSLSSKHARVLIRNGGALYIPIRVRNVNAMLFSLVGMLPTSPFPIQETLQGDLTYLKETTHHMSSCQDGLFSKQGLILMTP